MTVWRPSCDNMVQFEEDLTGLGASVAGALEAVSHCVVEVTDGEDAEIDLSLVPQVGMLEVDVCDR